MSQQPRNDYELAERIARTHECPDCREHSRLVVRRDFVLKRDFAACGGCGRRDGFIRRKSITQIWRENPEAVDPAMAARLADKYHEQIEAVAAGLPEDLAQAVREQYCGIRARKG